MKSPPSGFEGNSSSKELSRISPKNLTNEPVYAKIECTLDKANYAGELYLFSFHIGFYCEITQPPIKIPLENIYQTSLKNFSVKKVFIIRTNQGVKYVFSRFNLAKMKDFKFISDSHITARKEAARKSEFLSTSTSKAHSQHTQRTNSSSESEFISMTSSSTFSHEDSFESSFGGIQSFNSPLSLTSDKRKDESVTELFNMTPQEFIYLEEEFIFLNKDYPVICVLTESSFLFRRLSSLDVPQYTIPLKEIERIEKEDFMLFHGITFFVGKSQSLSFGRLGKVDDVYGILQMVIKDLSSKEEKNDQENLLGMSMDLNDVPTCLSRDEFSGVLTDFGSAFSVYECFTKELIKPLSFPQGKSLGDIFSLCFSDDSQLLEKYHSERGDIEQKIEKWRPTKDGGSLRGQRTFMCKTPVKFFFGKKYPYTEYQKYAFLRINGVLTLMLQFSSQISGVPTGEAFRAEALIVCTEQQKSAKSSVQMEAYGYVQFLRSVLMKNKILRTTLDTELPEGYKRIGELMTAEILSKSNRVEEKKIDESVAPNLPLSGENMRPICVKKLPGKIEYYGNFCCAFIIILFSCRCLYILVFSFFNLDNIGRGVLLIDFLSLLVYTFFFLFIIVYFKGILLGSFMCLKSVRDYPFVS